MFAYCLNNPVNGCDPCGFCFHRWDFWNDCELCIGLNRVEQLKLALANTVGTFSEGITGDVSLGFWSGGFQFGASADLHGNVEYQFSYFGGLTTGTPGGSLCLYGTATNAPNVTKLQGEGCSAGVSIAAGGALSVDAVFVPDKAEKTTYFGASVAGGFGGGADIHVTWGETVPVFNWSFNIFDVIESVLY